MMRRDTFFKLNTDTTGLTPVATRDQNAYGICCRAQSGLQPYTILCKINCVVVEKAGTFRISTKESYSRQSRLHQYVIPQDSFYLLNHSYNASYSINEDLGLATIKETDEIAEYDWHNSTVMLEGGWKLRSSGSRRSYRKLIRASIFYSHIAMPRSYNSITGIINKQDNS